MNAERLESFLHLIKPSGAYRLGSDYLTSRNAAKIRLILTSSEISPQSYAQVVQYASVHNIVHYDVPANIMTNLFKGKSVKVLAVINGQSAKKIANIMKEGDPYE